MTPIWQLAGRSGPDPEPKMLAYVEPPNFHWCPGSHNCGVRLRDDRECVQHSPERKGVA